jgi:nitroreductase
MMNPVIDAIKNRRSIRAYESKPIPRDSINTIIEAGNQAPSMARDEEGAILVQPWRFVVGENSEFKHKLVQTALPIWKNFMESIKETNPQDYGK